MTLSKPRSRGWRTCAARLPATGEIRPETVGSADHLELAGRLAEASVTLVRNDDGIIPIRLDAGQRIFSLEPEPVNVTPADTTSLYPPRLAAALRTRHPDVTEAVYPHHPGPNDIESVVNTARDHDLVVVGTVGATPGQAKLVDVLLATGTPVVTIALRTPYDVAAYPASTTHVCTYNAHTPSLEALASALFGAAPFRGHLPAAIPGLHPRGHGITS